MLLFYVGYFPLNVATFWKVFVKISNEKLNEIILILVLSTLNRNQGVATLKNVQKNKIDIYFLTTFQGVYPEYFKGKSALDKIAK